MADLAAVYAELRARLLRAAAGMTVDKDGPHGLVLHAPWAHPTKPREPMWFGAVRPGKAYASFHLMPVYSHPELPAGISPALRKRMQGKSCFNFKASDPVPFDELERLAEAGAARYAEPFRLARRDQARPAVGP